MYMLPRDLNGGEPRDSGMEGKRGTGQSAVFVARNRFAVLDKPGGLVLIKDMRNEVTKQFATPVNCTDVFYAGTKNILITTTTSVVLYDTELRENVAEINVAV
jgi:coatomer protein complex subunit alpha (xenin)